MDLKQQLMLNQFVNATGCSHDNALEVLASTKWQFEAAMSTFYQQQPTPASGFMGATPANTPANTPATPPNFPAAIQAFQNMNVDKKQRK